MVSHLLPNPFSELGKVLKARQSRSSEAGYGFRRILRKVATPLLISVTYYIGTRIGMALTPAGTPISGFWPPNAILLAGLLLTPIRTWWLVLLAVLPSHFIAQLPSGIPIAESLGWFVGNAGEALLGAVCITAFKKRGPLFDTVHGLVVFLVFGVLLAPLLTSFVDAWVVVEAGAKSYWLMATTRLFSNMLANITLVPTIVIFASKGLASIRRSDRIEEALLLAFGVIGVSLLAFGGASDPNYVPGLVYLPLPFLLWAAVRFGTGGLSASLLGISLISIWNAMHALGPFTSHSMAENVFSLKISLCIIAVPLMLLATMMVERRATEASLLRSKTVLQRRFALEQSISELSRGLTDIPGKQLDSAIGKGLQGTLEAAGAERVCWYVNRLGSSEFVQVYSVKAPGAPPAPVTVKADQVPYTATRLGQGEPVVICSLEDLPREALDRLYYKTISVGGLLLVPSVCGTRYRGVLGIAFSQKDDWLIDSISQFTLLANLIATTLERHEAEKERIESEQRFQALFKEAPIGIALEDLDGHLLFSNPALCSMLGYSEEELRSKSCSDFPDPDNPDDDWEYFQKLRAGLIAGYHLEKRYTRKDGTRMWGQLSVSLLSSSDSRRLVVGMVQDISERKAVEAGLRQRDTELQNLTNGLILAQEEERQRISRELHDDIGQRLALLTVGLTQLGQELPVSVSDQQSRLFDLVNEADELSTDVHDLSYQLHSSTLQHLGLRAALAGFCRKAQRQHQVAIKLEADDVPDIPSDVALCFFRVAQEAVSNAVNHGGAKEISLRLHEHDHHLQLRVLDKGRGFDTSSSPRGLGLVTMRERLRMLGGALVVKSAKGEGTEVTAELRFVA